VNKYVVACCDTDTGDIEQAIVTASTGFDAVCEFIGPIPESVTTETELFTWAYDHNLFINYIEI
jgi:hypothetical protein